MLMLLLQIGVLGAAVPKPEHGGVVAAGGTSILEVQRRISAA